MNEASRIAWGWVAVFALLISMGLSWRLLTLRALPESGRRIRDAPGLLAAVSRRPEFAFGFRNVLADVAWLEAVQVAGNLKMTRGDFDRLHDLLNVVENFDPKFEIPYLLGGLEIVEYFLSVAPVPVAEARDRIAPLRRFPKVLARPLR